MLSSAASLSRDGRDAEQPAGLLSDGRADFEREPIAVGTLTFDQLNASGPRQLS